MKAGKLDKQIEIQRYHYDGTDDNGNPIERWESLATVRAQIIQASTEEYIRSFGASSETVVVFRTHYLEGVSLADRIVFNGSIHNIREIKEIGRRRGLELRTISRMGERG